MTIYKSKVVSTNYDKFFRCLILENGMRVKTSLVLPQTEICLLLGTCQIKYINHELDHTIMRGYLNARNFDINTAKQILKDSFIGLLPYSKNVINFVWSLDNRVLSGKVNFNYHNEIIERLNSFFCKYDISFDQLKYK